MKRTVLVVAIFSLISLAALSLSFIFRPAEAQRSLANKFEYAIINGSYFPYPADGPTVVTAAVNICYLQSTGCQNEESKAEVGIAKFVQDERIENNPRVKGLAQERAIEIALSKALAKLGSEGWEIIDAPSVEFDLFYTSQQGNQVVKEGNRTDRQHIWLKRARQ
ncbi:MAG: hypothetical protein ACJ72Z_13910 [Pyrinomonadaceae bacterium]